MPSPADLARPIPEVVIPKPAFLGPAMKALTPKRQKFVIAYMHYGMQKGFGARAAMAAGYKGSDGTLKSNAYALLRDPRVIAAFNEEIAKADVLVGWRAKERILEIAESDNENTALAANKMLLEVGGHFTKKVEMTVRHELTELPTEELERRISELEKAEVEKRIAARMLNPPIDAEFVIVETEPHGECHEQFAGN